MLVSSSSNILYKLVILYILVWKEVPCYKFYGGGGITDRVTQEEKHGSIDHRAQCVEHMIRFSFCDIFDI